MATADHSGSTTGSTTPSIPVLDDHTHTSHPLNGSTLQTVTPARSTASSIIFPISKSNDAPVTTNATATATIPTFLAAEQGTSLPPLMDWQDIEMDGGMLADMGNMLQFDLEPASPVRVLGGFKMTNLVLADLNQLYFDRLHDVLPMIHRRRYFSWADQEKPSLARSCLRSAMHTVAAAVSTQYHSLGDALYQETCQLLESQCMRTLSASGSSDGSWLTSANNSCPRPSSVGDKIPIEMIQAWLLLAHYDLLRVDEHQAMVTAGRAFRLVQLARLYDVDEGSNVEDMPNNPAGSEGDQCEGNLSYIVAEEKRRTFWLAFSFDRFLCSRNEWPLTLQEDAVRTRLPSSEASFQNNQPTQVCFLSEALAMSGSANFYASTMIPLSPFAECVVLAALHGRCMTHRRMSMLRTGTADAQEFWARHDQLTLAVEKRTQILAQSPSLKTINRNPIVLFTHMLAHKSIIYLSSTLEIALLQQQQQQQQTGDRQLFASSYKWRAERAAIEIMRLAESARSLGCFSMHPFIAGPLACAADFFIRRAQYTNISRASGSAGCHSSSSSINSSNSSISGNDGEVESLLFVLRNLGCVNNLAQDHLSTLEAEYNTWCAGDRSSNKMNMI
ncbi:hypothetical protein N7517_000510 [Penicillium concentricum]|uniref:Xylanolytic transcriptional activator regulatory domain-containing protein n=1 Tax=Penicillium concentricum TaxID=293559 RepID=A0A9W9VJ06_9EURO|nr:uncharacterized protein N7517_000510 [Penicillium concentricum]KAJ5382599.1 hypothetical protein N7517_000510 [Penicillium concentricum]